MPDIDIRKLRVLCELDARGTITEVGSALHLTPSAVSQQIASLGREVGVSLIEPHGRRVRLTGAGKMLVKHGRKILTDMEHASASLAAYTNGSRSEVHIADGTLAGIGLPAVLRLREVQPNLSVSLHEIDVDESTAMLLRGDTDMLIGVASSLESVMDDGRFVATSLLVDHYDLALPASHRLARAQVVQLADLAAEDWVFPSLQLCRELGLFACRAAGFMPSVVHVMGNWASTLTAVRFGLGVALVPRLGLTAMPSDVVVRAVTGRVVQPYHVVAIVRRGTQDAPHIAVVLDVLKEIVQDEVTTIGA